MPDHQVAVPLVLGLAADDATGEQAASYVPASLGEIVAELRAAYPHTPLLALSALGSAAELVAAQAALALGVPVVACVAHPADAGVDSPLQTLLAACAEMRVADESFDAHAPFAAEAQVAHFSDLLIAFGATPEPGSRLAAVVTLRENGRFPGRHARGRILDPPDVGPLRRVVPGSGGAYAVERRYPPRYYGDRTSERDAVFSLDRLDEFNADVRADASDGALFSERIERRADAFTNSLQRHFVFWQRFLYWAAFVAASAEFILPKTGWATIVDFAAVAVAFAAYFIARPRKFQGRYQDYRAISEGLRVQTAWSKAGVVQSVAEAYLRMQQTELQWIRNVLRTIALLQGARAVPQGGLDRDAVVEWVGGQREYFRNASRREARHERTFEQWSNVLTPVNVVLGLGIFAFVAITKLDPVIPVLTTTEHRYTLELLVGTFAGWAALSAAVLHSYARARGFSENANRYERMFLMFDEAALWLSGEAGRPVVEVRELAAELGREALAEHAEWLLSQRDRPLAIVHAGAG
jgi:hypothetical protein